MEQISLYTYIKFAGDDDFPLDEVNERLGVEPTTTWKFYVAEQNLLSALTNEPCFVYKGYAVTINSDTAEILLADYDGQAAIFLTNSEEDIYAKMD